MMPPRLHSMMPRLTNGTAAVASAAPLFCAIKDRLSVSQILVVQIASSETRPNGTPTIVL
jgi:hypothetical protein